MKTLSILLVALASAAVGQSCPPSPPTQSDDFSKAQVRLTKLEASNQHQTVGQQSAHCVPAEIRGMFPSSSRQSEPVGSPSANQQNAGYAGLNLSRDDSGIPGDGTVLNELINFEPQPRRYYRLQLKHGGQYLDSDHCTTRVALFGLSEYDNGGCQLWRLVPGGEGYYRLQLKHGGQFLDSDHCTTTVALFGRSDYDNGGCQLWRLVSEGNGYYRLQLKHGGQYLDSDHCTTRVALFGRSDYDDGACQLWRFVPEAVPID